MLLSSSRNSAVTVATTTKGGTAELAAVSERALFAGGNHRPPERRKTKDEALFSTREKRGPHSGVGLSACRGERRLRLQARTVATKGSTANMQIRKRADNMHRRKPAAACGSAGDPP